VVFVCGVFQLYKHRHKLVCRFRTNNNPLLVLQPGKEEEMYLDPYIVLYHDVIADHEIAVIKQLATPRVGFQNHEIAVIQQLPG
jgi:hypothetical protein